MNVTTQNTIIYRYHGWSMLTSSFSIRTAVNFSIALLVLRDRLSLGCIRIFGHITSLNICDEIGKFTLIFHVELIGCMSIVC